MRWDNIRSLTFARENETLEFAMDLAIAIIPDFFIISDGITIERLWKAKAELAKSPRFD